MILYTVHGALSAALIRAARKCSPGWKDIPLRVHHPSSLRSTLGVGEDSCVYINSKLIVAEPNETETFWDIARHIKNELKHMKTLATVKELVTFLRGHFFVDIKPQTMADAIRLAADCEIMISNLGNLPYAPEFGELKITSVWGPLSLTGSPEEQIIGIATVNGEIAITQASRSPLRSLLQTAELELKDACS